MRASNPSTPKVKSMRIAFSVLVALLVLSAALFAAPAKDDKSTPVYSMIYAVSDLPVWQKGKDGKECKPDILIMYLKATVDPTSWKKDSLRADTKSATIVISQTEANHRAIRCALNSFRDQDPREAQETYKRQ